MLAAALSFALAAAPETFVLLKPGATLFPPAGVMGVDAGARLHKCCHSEEGQIAARLIRDEGDFLQIESIFFDPDSTLHCGAQWDPSLDRLKIRLRVKRDSVLPVLSRPLKLPWAEAAAGLPVEVLDGGVRIGLYETTRDFTLPADQVEVGAAYVASRWKPRERTSDRSFRALRGVTGEVGDGGTVILLSGESWPSAAVTLNGEDALIALEDRCSRVLARVPSAGLMELDAGTNGSGSIDLCGHGAAFFVRRGAAVYWPDGTKAGVTLGGGLTGLQPAGPPARQRKCFVVTFDAVSGALPLCFDSRDVSDKPFK